MLPEGATIAITITATVVAGFTGTLENIARVGSSTPDPVIANNEAKISGRTTQSANLGVHKTASAQKVIAGTTLRYMIAALALILAGIGVLAATRSRRTRI